MNSILLYHSSNSILKDPDLHYGRKNADFAQGFYTSEEKEFCLKWSRETKGMPTYINSYALNPEGLKVLTLSKEEAWISYLLENRSLKEDRYAEYDVIVGPIAGDILYDTFGIGLSGMLSKELSTKLMLAGPNYTQTVIKSEKAKSQLTFLGAEDLSRETLRHCKALLKKEEEAYQKEIASLFESYF